jgi:two-component system, OmpR family, response regulator
LLPIVNGTQIANEDVSINYSRRLLTISSDGSWPPVSHSEHLEPQSDADALMAAVCEELLNRAKDVATGITDRIRNLLGPIQESITFDRPDRPLRVLCVDDYRDAADTLATVLNLMGCEARACYDGPAAIDTVRDFHPDVCLLDLMMPGMDGVQLATRLRAGVGCRPLLIAATTALGSIEDQALTAIAGFHFHLVKPFSPERIREVIASARNLLHMPSATAGTLEQFPIGWRAGS